MAREYVRQGTPDADGLRDMTVLQRIGEAKPEEVTYRTFGEEANAPMLWATWVAKIAKDTTPSGVENLAAHYGSWVYGEDLKARQKGKQGGPSEPLVAIGPKELVNLVTGQIHNRENPKETIPGQDWPLADRIEFANSIATTARLSRKPTPKNVQAGIDGLVEAGVCKVESGRLVAVAAKPNGPAKK